MLSRHIAMKSLQVRPGLNKKKILKLARLSFLDSQSHEWGSMPLPPKQFWQELSRLIGVGKGGPASVVEEDRPQWWPEDVHYRHPEREDVPKGKIRDALMYNEYYYYFLQEGGYQCCRESLGR